VSDSADRRTAVRLLVRIESGAWAGRLLAADPAPGVRARVLTVLRWQGALDGVLERWTKRPLARLDSGVRATLRVGLAEATRLGVPPPVAVDAAVRTVRGVGLGSAAGLVNAVLRRAVDGFDGQLSALPEACRLSFPEWLATRWRAELGDELARTAMRSVLEPAPVWAWFPTSDTRHQLEVSGVELRPHPWVDGLVTADDAAALVAGARDRLAYVQDPASAIVADAVERVLGVRGGRVADLCAAPGGKAWRIVTRAPGADVVALDRHVGRTRLASAALSGTSARGVVVADASRPPLADRAFDVVLLDAPCSGTGTLRRHPEIKWRLQAADLGELAVTQLRLLDAACELVAEGGALVYATCSVEPEENDHHFRSERRGFQRIDPRPFVPAACPTVATGTFGVRIPPNPESDGFTVHVLRRTSGA
jgi:16S rRNA (cytosine967-C5)-methyltransferase